jgi:CRP/FNR family cyclic AMP-dependent transcriptional regulator
VQHDPATSAFVCRTFACTAEVAEQILARARLANFAGQAVIVRQGDQLSLAWLLMLGSARAFLCTAEGQMVLLHEFRPGDFFGSLGETEGARQDADIVAVEPVSALQFEGAQLALLAQHYGCIGLALSRLLIQRLRATTARMYERSALSAVGRVYSELLRLAREHDDLAIRPAPVLSDLALRMSTTRETASRAVSGLERRGIVRREADALVIVAPRRLEEMIL